MRRFLLRENVRRFERYLADGADEASRSYISVLVADMRRELAQLNAAILGAQHFKSEFGPAAPEDMLRFREFFEAANQPNMLIDPRPGLNIVDVTDAYAAATLISRHDVSGNGLFQVFPDNPDLENADGVANLYASLRRAAHSGRTDYMPIQRYDVRDAAGHFVEKHWLPSNTPLFNEAGQLIFMLHQAEDVTLQVLSALEVP